MNHQFYHQSRFVIRRIAALSVAGVLLSVFSFGQSRPGARNIVSFGQSAGLKNDTLYLNINQDIAVQLMPFDELVRIAVSYSPLLKYQAEVSNSLNAAYDASKVQVLQNVAGFGNYSTGNQSLISTGAALTGRDPIGQIANGYRAGVEVRVSLFDLFGRKHLIKQAYSNYRASLIQKEALEQQLRREMIGIYQDMITTQQILKIRLLDEQASLAAYRIAEAEIQKGKITADQLASATSSYVESKAVTEQVKGEFLKNVHYFENLVGVPIQRLKRLN